MKRLIAVFIAVLCICSTLAPSVSAATGTSATKAKICTGSGYQNFSTTKMNGQTKVEKYVKVSKGKTLQITPRLSIGNGNTVLAKYTRFTVWIYDINTGKRIVNKVCSYGDFLTWKNTGNKTVHLSVQIRPYIAQSAFKVFPASTINYFIKNTTYDFKWNNAYKK